MAGFRTPEIPRDQLVLWEQRLEDAIPPNHAVRHLDFLLSSSIFSTPFVAMEREYSLVRGQPPYHPRVMSGLYLYGMLRKIRSSRRLEEACYSRLDVIWLMEGQKPDHSTISDFVSKHGQDLRKLFRDTLKVMVRAGLIKLEHVAIDGSKVEGDAGKKSIRKEAKIRSWEAHLEEKITALEKEWAENEQREASLYGDSSSWFTPKAKNAKQELAHLERQQARLRQALAQIARRRQEHVGRKAPAAVASTTDPDARSMKDKEGRSKANYNTQLGVDGAFGAIVAADVNDQPDDSGQLTGMVEQVIENCGRAPGGVSADSQYNSGPELAAMEEKQIDCYMPDAGQNSEAAPLDAVQQEALEAVRRGCALTQSQCEALPKNSHGRIDKSAFVYDEQSDTYRCPAGGTLVYLRTSQDQKKGGTVKRRQYGGCTACANCPVVSLCTKEPSKGRTLNRDQYEDHRERLRKRMGTDVGREIYKRRKCTVEPAIGHIKHNQGVRRFLRRGGQKVKTEWMMVCTVVNLGIILRNWEEVVKIL
jgi:transposase